MDHLFFEEKEGNKYLNFDLTDNNVEVLKKYADLLNEIKNLIQKVIISRVNMEKIS